MAEGLPYLYALITLAELAWLFQRYLADPPGSKHPLSIMIGWAGLIAMVVMLVYSIARRSRRLRQIARLSYWLHFHIFLGVQGAVLVLFHSSHLFRREAPIHLLNPGFLSFVAVMIVFCSGIFGRYLYSMLPHTIKGERMEASDIEAEIAKMSQLPAEVSALWQHAPKMGGGLVALIKADFAARRAGRTLAKLPLAEEIKTLAQRRLQLERRLITHHAAERIFRRWIVAHRPMAAIMYVLAAVHVILSYMFTPGI